MSFANITKGKSSSVNTKGRVGPPSPHPQKKTNELGIMEPIIGGIDGRGILRTKRFENVTQTISIAEALPLNQMQLISLGDLMKVRLGDNKTAHEYCLSEVVNKLIQVRPGEGVNGIDIVVFGSHSYNLIYFHLHLYFDMSIKFRQAIITDTSKKSLYDRVLDRENELSIKNEIEGLMLSDLADEDIYDDEAIANITGSPVQKDKEMD